MGNILGVDIGSSSIKMALYDGKYIRKVVSARMPQNLVKEGKITSLVALGELIKVALKENKIRVHEAAVVLPAESIYVRTTKMPLMNTDQLRLNLPYEFNDYLNEEPKNYLFDYSVVSISDVQDSDKKVMEIMAMAVPRKLIEDLREMFRNIGLKLVKAAPAESCYISLIRECEESNRIEQIFNETGKKVKRKKPKKVRNQTMTSFLEAYEKETSDNTNKKKRKKSTRTTARVVDNSELIAQLSNNSTESQELESNETDETDDNNDANTGVIEEQNQEDVREYGFIDLGYSQIRMLVFRNDKHIFTRNLDSGLRMLESVVAEQFDVDPHIARTYINENYNNCQESEACKQAYLTIAVELSRALNFYRFSNQSSTLNDVWLCSGGRVIDHLKDIIASQMDVEVHQVTELIPVKNNLGNLNVFAQAVGITMEV